MKMVSYGPIVIFRIAFCLDPITGAVKHYATSNPSKTGNLVTLPYINIYRDGKVWFNEHYGNAIASFDTKNNTLVEYYIQSHNSMWINSSNPLRFTIDNNGSIWFTEWTENKLATIPSDRLNLLPISVNLSKDYILLDNTTEKGDTIDLYIRMNKIDNTSSPDPTSILEGSNAIPSLVKSNLTQSLNQDINVTMDVTSGMSRDGKLTNITNSFDPAFIINPSIGELSKTTLKIDPNGEINLGNYTLTISAKYNKDLTVSKIVDLIVK